jgi:starvation-inducible outer membrane lipoprotein
MRYALVMPLMFLLTGCSTLTGTVETNRSACEVWKDVSWSSKDTTQTIIEVKINNARREGYCG